MNSSIERLEIMFEKMLQDGFDTVKPLKWGFYFFDSNRDKLYKVYEELKDKEYKLENIIQMDDGLWRLFVSKVDTLTPEKLHKRNVAFNELAEYCSVSLYDGWDVEKLSNTLQ